MKTERRGAELSIAPDAFNEQVVLAAALLSREFRAQVVRHPPDVFLVPAHQEVWGAVREAQKQGLEPTSATLLRLSRGKVDATYLDEVLRGRPDVPAEGNLRHALDALLWDRKRFEVLTGPVSAFLECITDGEGDRGRALGLARAIPTSLDGWGDRKHLLDPEGLVRSQIADIRERMAGRRVYPFGLPGLDYFDPTPGQDPSTVRRRILPGAAPGRVTVVTGSTKSGKSTVLGRLVLGLARQKRKTLYGAWEKSGGMTLEMLTCMSLGWSRADLMEGKLDEARLAEFETRMRAISPWVQFLANPFRRTSGEKLSNARNLDVLQGYIADSGCEIFVGDLFERCLVDDEPSEEKQALFRFQAMMEELQVHGLIAAQQRKDVSTRSDPHPTVEGIKGSGAWGEIGDLVIGVYRLYQFKPVPDNVIELTIPIQRDGKDMLAVEFEWDADRGMITGGRSTEYARPDSGRGGSNPVDVRVNPRKKS